MGGLRRCGAHKVVVDGDAELTQAVVEIMGDRVVNYYEFRDELPMTEWFGGLIEVRTDSEGIRRAYHQGQMLSE